MSDYIPNLVLTKNRVLTEAEELLIMTILAKYLNDLSPEEAKKIKKAKIRHLRYVLNKLIEIDPKTWTSVRIGHEIESSCIMT